MMEVYPGVQVQVLHGHDDAQTWIQRLVKNGVCKSGIPVIYIVENKKKTGVLLLHNKTSIEKFFLRDWDTQETVFDYDDLVASEFIASKQYENVLALYDAEFATM